MKFLYILFSYLIHPFLLLILKLRVLKGKDDPIRFGEKLGVIKNQNLKNVIWFHVASLGEIKSIAPLIKHYQKYNELTLLITSVTMSSYEYFKNDLKSENTIHQYAPLDTPIIVRKFINNWRPKVSVFVESEIWPNLIYEASKNSKLILLNCRISKKSFKKWKYMKSFFHNIISKFETISVQNEETADHLKYFNITNIKNLGHLKFINDNPTKPNFLKIHNLNKSWAAMSVHFAEIKSVVDTHIALVKKHGALTTFLIPRHLDKIKDISNIILDNKIDLQLITNNPIIESFNGIVLVDKFGIADDIFDKVKIVFMGGSFIKHGGQNPIEPSNYGCKVLHGTYISNFVDVYNFLEKQNVSKLTSNVNELIEEIDIFLRNKDNIINEEKINTNSNIFGKTTSFLNTYIFNETV